MSDVETAGGTDNINYGLAHNGSRSGFGSRLLLPGLAETILELSGAASVVTSHRLNFGRRRNDCDGHPAENSDQSWSFHGPRLHKVFHVRIYIGGDHFVHAAHHGVVVASLRASHWVRRFAGPRRLIEYAPSTSLEAECARAMSEVE